MGVVISALILDFRYSSSKGLFPSIFNLASHAEVTANATCGQHRAETYCTLAEGGAAGTGSPR